MSILSFLVAWVGHGYLLMVVLNVTYSQPFNRVFLKTLRKLFGLLLVAPLLFASFVSHDLVAIVRGATEDPSHWMVAAYPAVCLFMGAIAFPAVTIRRLLRSDPRCVLASETRVFDVANHLGHPPVGDGKHAGVAGLSWNHIYRVDFSYLTLAVPGLPRAWDGLTILHLSDLHFYGSPSQAYFDAIIRRCLEDGVPDLVVVSGDIVDEQKYLDWIVPVLSPLQATHGKFAILGNHDWWQDFDGVRGRLSEAGLTVVSNRWTTIDVRGEQLLVAGHEGPWFRPGPELAGAPDCFRLLISHTPDNIGWARSNQFRLMLSGHNHGGQIRLPVIGSMFVPSKFSRKYDMGTFHEPPTVLHVNRGLAGKEPIRFRCPPQVSRLTLRTA